MAKTLKLNKNKIHEPINFDKDTENKLYLLEEFRCGEFNLLNKQTGKYLKITKKTKKIMNSLIKKYKWNADKPLVSNMQKFINEIKKLGL